ncbi:thioredoxin family protein [Myroides sp. LoEW2-1]|uniref:thioredoxin family protein n=1 Tax=Myroides sp. LoEW2-1 TaxID=2683192 RepID=UPI0013291FE1|nr:thioredoxin family protein [Myroides sp. LoEW2-1]MVX37011.1 thioredoxin fold domain-containing protein [Myroides sp. LoEW2-1]
MQINIDFDNLERPILLQFFANWCAPCKTLSKYINHIEEDIKAYVDFIKVDIDIDKVLKQEFFVRSVPTLILVNTQGDIYWRQTGVVSPQEIIKHVSQVER